MTNFERRPFDENPYWSFSQANGFKDTIGNFEDK